MIVKIVNDCKNCKKKSTLSKIVNNVKKFNIVKNCFQKNSQNIARGTTDPEIDSVTWIEFSNNITPSKVKSANKYF